MGSNSDQGLTLFRGKNEIISHRKKKAVFRFLSCSSLTFSQEYITEEPGANKGVKMLL